MADPVISDDPMARAYEASEQHGCDLAAAARGRQPSGDCVLIARDARIDRLRAFHQGLKEAAC